MVLFILAEPKSIRLQHIFRCPFAHTVVPYTVLGGGGFSSQIWAIFFSLRKYQALYSNGKKFTVDCSKPGFSINEIRVDLITSCQHARRIFCFFPFANLIKFSNPIIYCTSERGDSRPCISDVGAVEERSSILETREPHRAESRGLQTVSKCLGLPILVFDNPLAVINVPFPVIKLPSRAGLPEPCLKSEYLDRPPVWGFHQ